MPRKKNVVQTGDGRTRNWACIFWPDSAPENFIDIINDWHVPAFLSPLHHGYHTDEGLERKDHYHVMVMFSGPKTKEQVNELFFQLGGITLGQTVSINDSVAYARYLIHMDNPEKEQFNISDVKCFGGANYDDFISNASDDGRILKEIFNYCLTTGTYYYADLLVYCMQENEEWYNVIIKRQRENVWKFLRSLQFKIDNEGKQAEITGQAISPLLADSSDDFL